MSAKNQYLVFDGENIPMPVSHGVDLTDVLADSSGTTEAGTTQRDVIREGVVEIKVSFHVSKKWLMKLAAYKKKSSIQVTYRDQETNDTLTKAMYIDGYNTKLVHDTSYGSLWEVSFSLKEF